MPRFSMFTIKPANDTDEFYATIRRIEDAPKIKTLWEEMEDAYSGSISNPQTLPPPSTPAASEADTSPAPSPPHAADVS